MNGLKQKPNKTMVMSSAENTGLIKEQYLQLYTENLEKLSQHSGDLMNKLRGEAMLNFRQNGIPTRKTESYKYTNLEPILAREYASDFSPDLISQLKLSDIFRCEVPNLNTHTVLVVNGFYYHDNHLTGLPEGVIVCSLAYASVYHSELFNRHYGAYADTSLDSMTALNTMMAQDGVFIYIPKGVVLDKPIQVINLCYTFKDLRVNRRNLIIAEPEAGLEIMMCDHTLCNRSYLTNSLTEIVAGENAAIDFSRLQNENNRSSQLTHAFIRQEAGSRVSTNILSLHGGFIRNSIYVRLNGPGAHNDTFGLFICDENQHVTNFTHIEHAREHCTSNQLIKGILSDNATGAFNGKIYVAPDAQKTVAYQKSQNILLSSESKMNIKPQLEIYADDVKCSHGATIGQLDTEALFYLRSRGIPENEARHLLMYAFANEIISRLRTDTLRERIIELVDKRLRGDLSKCNDCEISCG